MNSNVNTKALTRLIHRKYREKFNSASAAQRYSTRHTTSHKGKRELDCIRKALADVEKNSYILDLPCGTGRLSYEIKNMGFKVLGADYSTHMLEFARNHPSSFAVKLGEEIQFEQQDVTAIQYPDNQFDAVVCNRLFHHYPTSELRQQSLKELARVTKGPVIVSFFNSYSLSALFTKLKNFVRNKNPMDRQAIPFNLFKKDIKAAGLKIEKVYYTYFGLSPQTYVKLVKQ